MGPVPGNNPKSSGYPIIKEMLQFAGASGVPPTMFPVGSPTQYGAILAILYIYGWPETRHYLKESASSPRMMIGTPTLLEHIKVFRLLGYPYETHERDAIRIGVKELCDWLLGLGMEMDVNSPDKRLSMPMLRGNVRLLKKLKGACERIDADWPVSESALSTFDKIIAADEAHDVLSALKGIEVPPFPPPQGVFDPCSIVFDPNANKSVYFLIDPKEDYSGEIPANAEVKIGTSKNVEARLYYLRTSNRRLFLYATLPGGYKMESRIHRLCQEYRITQNYYDGGSRETEYFDFMPLKRTIDALVIASK